MKLFEKTRLQVSQTQPDPLAPARGVVHGVRIMAVFWIVVALLVGAYLAF